jgi:hypothetical protein
VVWRSVAGLLQSAGEVSTYEVWPPSGLADQVAAVLTVCQARHIETLVTWSYSGLVGTLVATSAEQLRRLVHVDALLPGFATSDGEIRRLVSPAIARLLGRDWSLAIAPGAPSCAVEYTLAVDGSSGSLVDRAVTMRSKARRSSASPLGCPRPIGDKRQLVMVAPTSPSSSTVPR